MKKVVSIVGTRPNFIKVYALSKKIEEELEHKIIHTGQHYDYEMSQVFFNQLGIGAPNYHLDVCSTSHIGQISNIMQRIEHILFKEKPDLVLVYGDSNSTLAGALASSSMDIPVCHIEAGLRSFDKTMPEERNRILVDHMSDLLLAPTMTAKDNLLTEGIEGAFLTEDLMHDVLIEKLDVVGQSGILNEFNVKKGRYYLATVHRKSNTDDESNLRKLLDTFSSIQGDVIFPVHPRTAKFINDYKMSDMIGKNIIISRPLSYINFLSLVINANKVLTDSGGVQKEAYWLKVPCITLRENTEWIETVKNGWNLLVGTDKEQILNAVENFCPSDTWYKPFGDCGEDTKDVILDFLGGLTI